MTETKRPKSIRRKFTAKKSAPAVPPGSYDACLVRFEEEKSKAFGKLQLKAVFEIRSPKKYAGRELARWVNLENDAGEPIEMTEQSGLFKLFRELNGGKLSVDDEVECEDFVDCDYSIVVTHSDTGFAKITAILPVDDEEDDEVDVEDEEDEADEEEEVAPPRKSKSKRKTTKRRSRKEEQHDPDVIPFDAPEPDDE